MGLGGVQPRVRHRVAVSWDTARLAGQGTVRPAMKAVYWSPALALGHAEIDTQHEELFRRVADLVHAMTSGDRPAVDRLFDFLGEYVIVHFAVEEKLMAESDYPGFNVHRASHQRFVREYESLRKLHGDIGTSAGVAVAVKAHTWLSGWLTNHIRSADQLLAKHLRGREAKVS